MDSHSPESLLAGQFGAEPTPDLPSCLKRYAFICNDRAGSRVFRGITADAPSDSSNDEPLDQLIRRLTELGHETRRFPCSESAEATASRAIREGYEVIVAVGGDGTVSGCAAAVWKQSACAVLGVVPAGTLNHFAKDIGIPDIASAFRALADGNVRYIDIATVNGLPFVNNSGIGLYPVLVRKREFTRKAGIPKWIAFAFAMFGVLLRLPLRRLRLEADGNRLFERTPFLFVGNNVYRVEGIEIGTRERMDGGLLGIYATRAPGRLALLRLAFRAVFGRIREERDFLSISSQRLTVRSRHHHIQISLDGELHRLHPPLEYRILPGELPVIAPQPGPQK